MAKVKTNWSNSFHLTTTHRLITFWFLKHVSHVKVIGNEECNTTQIIVADITVDDRYPKTRIVPPRRKVWKLRNPDVRKDYEIYVNEKCTELFSNEWVAIGTKYSRVD